ncbi:MAG: hypothetical protein QXV35_00955 [Archaeoglobaceae archaeon]
MESKRLFIEFAVFEDRIIVNTNDSELNLRDLGVGEEEYSGLCG